MLAIAKTWSNGRGWVLAPPCESKFSADALPSKPSFSLKVSSFPTHTWVRSLPRTSLPSNCSLSFSPDFWAGPSFAHVFYRRQPALPASEGISDRMAIWIFYFGRRCLPPSVQSFVMPSPCVGQAIPNFLIAVTRLGFLTMGAPARLRSPLPMTLPYLFGLPPFPSLFSNTSSQRTVLVTSSTHP